jgi:cytochrome b involved in lipid metabolism
MSYQVLAVAAAAVFLSITGLYFFISPALNAPAEVTVGEYQQDSEAPTQDMIRMPESEVALDDTVAGNGQTGSLESVEADEVQTQPVAGVPAAPEPAATVPAQLSMAQVRENNSEASCWTVINGTVYDLTSFIERHPGGARGILRLCGVDGTESFMDQHGGQARPEQTLERYALGPLTVE